jgi:LacI family transcriptional regulator
MTIYDLAEYLHCSPSVVARALSGKGYVKKAKKDKILEAAKKMGYVPNASAKALRVNQTKKVLFCIPDICNPFYFRMINGVSRVLDESGFYVMLYHTKNDVKKEIEAVDLVNQKYCDGVIFTSFDFSPALLKAIQETGKPFVLTNLAPLESHSNYDCVYVDHTLGMELLTQHLLEQGAKRILLLIGDLSKQTSHERFLGYRSALQKAGIPLEESLIKDGAYSVEGGYRAMKAVLAEKLPFDGLISANDLMGIGASQALGEQGLVLGKDYLFGSFDNTDFTLYHDPTVTSIDMQQDRIGSESAKLLLERILSGRTQSKVVRIVPQLVVRHSTKR